MNQKLRLYKPLIISILYLFTHFSTFAQNINVKRYLKEADNYLSILDFQTAVFGYQEILKVEPDNLEANFKTGFCFLHSTHREKALQYLLKVHKSALSYQSNIAELMVPHPQYIKPFNFLLGEAYHFNNLFREATKYYELTKKEYQAQQTDPKNLKNQRLQKELLAKIRDCDKKIQECKFGAKYISEPVNSQISNVGATINSKASDYAPVISADESILVLTSRREGTTGDGVDRLDGQPYEDIYIATKKDGKWTTPKNVGRPINSKYHDASIAISADGKQLFIYQDNNRGTGDIFTAKINPDGSWSNLKSMGDNINTEFHEPSVSIASDGKTVYFSSNRPGGFGGLDIYKSQKQADGEWGEAVNLGSTINTEYDDDAPFISFNGKHLYFSSRGHSSMGDFDIFRATFEKEQWGEPENLGFPINTADNDIYFVLSADEKTGYYASAKEGGYGAKDIYMIKMPEPIPIDLIAKKQETDLLLTPPKVELSDKLISNQQKPQLLLRGTIRDKITKEPLEANINLNELFSGDKIQDLTSEADNGHYASKAVNWQNKYIISVQKSGYLFHSQGFSTPEELGKNEEVIVDIELEPLKVGAKINLVIFFDFDKAHLRPESNTELKRLLNFMQKHPGVQVEIAGHTDNIGTDQKNRILSNQRAKAVVDYLLDNNIPEERMRYVGYGFHKPIAKNQNPDGSDNPQGRQLNRRTECIVTAVE
jgi:outer membrane protein OmpA-like peptidoglycan-associated protein